MEHHGLLSGFVRLHLLHHAADGELYGQWMIGELARHGYPLSAGDAAMEQRGYLTSRRDRHGRAVRRLYSVTPLGREGLAVARTRPAKPQGEVGPPT